MSELPRSFVPDPAHESMQAEKTPNQIKLREMLREIDEEKLRDIFLYFFSLTGKDESFFGYVPLKEIVVVDDPYIKNRGEYNYETKQITLNSHRVPENQTALLHVFIHEQLHAIRDYNHDVEEVLSDFAEEGLTELITKDIHAAYIKGTEGTEEYSIAKQYFEKNRQTGPYSINQKAVDFYISLLAVMQQSDPTHMRNLIYKAHIRKETILPSQTRKALDEVAPQFGAKIYELLDTGVTRELWNAIIKDIKSSEELTDDEVNQILEIAYKISNEEKTEEKAAA